MRLNAYKKYILPALLVLVLIFVALWFMGGTPQTVSSFVGGSTVMLPEKGGFKSLGVAAQEDRALRQKINKLVSYDEAYLFVNYKEVNNLVVEILFLWSGLTQEQIERMGGTRSVNFFLRKLYGLSDDEPVIGHPLLGDRPWPRLFAHYKARLLMQGAGYKIYNGEAFYDSERDRLVVNGGLSKGFVKGLSKFIKTQPVMQRKAYINNFLVFVDQTKGLKNLSAEEKKILRHFD